MTRLNQHKNILVAGLAFFLASFLFLPWNMAEGGINAQTLSTVKRHIVVGGDYNYPPYERIDEHGQPAGFNVDLVRAIAEVMDWEVTFQLGPWDEVRRELATGKIDVLPMYSSAERLDVVDFTDPFEMIYYEVFTRRSSQPVLSLDEIRGLEVIVQREALMHDHLKQNDRGARLVLVESEPEALRLLASGKHDCAIVSRIGGLYAISRLKLANLATSGAPLLPRGYSLAVRKGNIELRDQLKQGLAIIKKTGRHEEISRKWFGEIQPPAITLLSMLRYAVWIVAPLIFLAAAAFVWAKMLQKKVAQKTWELSIELGERKQVEEDLRLYEHIVSKATELLSFLDKDYVYRAINNTYCRYHQKNREEILGHSVAELYGRETFEKVIRPVLDRALGGETVSYESWFEFAGMGKRFAAVEYVPFLGKDGIAGVVVSVRDLTERSQAETELRESKSKLESIFRAAPTGIGLVSNRVLLDVNERICQMTGYSRNELIGKDARMLYPTDEDYEYVGREKYVQIRERGTGTVETRWKRKDGEIIDVLLSSTPNDLEDHSAGVTFTALDITERKQIEEELEKHRDRLEERVQERTKDVEDTQKALLNLLEDVNEAKNELEKANVKLLELDRLKSMFIASMSHELRTPLNSIIGFTGIMLQGLTGDMNDEQRDQLGRVKRAGQHLLMLITDVIDVSKIEAGKVSVHAEVCDLAGVICEAAETIRPEADAKGLTLEVSVPKDVSLKTDRRRLLQCVLNFLSNAVRYTERGSIRVAAQLMADDGREGEGTRDDGRRTKDEASIVPGNEATGHPSSVVISVSDTGIGIAEADLPLLFNSFVRLKSHLKIKTPGTGLGLYLTKKIATELLGGEVFVESREGVGSTFGLRIPLEIAI